MRSIEYSISADESGFRADRIVANIIGDVNYAFLQKIFRTKKVKVNGKRANASDRLKEGDEIKIFVSQEQLQKPQKSQGTAENTEKIRELAEQFRRMIIFENTDFLAVNKPTNLAVQMGSKVKMSLETMMRAYNKELRLVHRIDKDTSGILIIAKGRSAAQKLTKMFRENRIHKTYLAIVDGKIKKGGVIDNYLHKTVVGNEEKIAVVGDLNGLDGARRAITEYIPRNISDPNFKYYTLLELHPKTGRKHQLRVHCADVLRAPILGDKKYDRNFLKNFSKNSAKYRYLMLHAYKVEIDVNAVELSPHPNSCRTITIVANLPEYFPDFSAEKALLAQIQLSRDPL